MFLVCRRPPSCTAAEHWWAFHCMGCALSGLFSDSEGFGADPKSERNSSVRKPDSHY